MSCDALAHPHWGPTPPSTPAPTQAPCHSRLPSEVHAVRRPRERAHALQPVQVCVLLRCGLPEETLEDGSQSSLLDLREAGVLSSLCFYPSLPPLPPPPLPSTQPKDSTNSVTNESKLFLPTRAQLYNARNKMLAGVSFDAYFFEYVVPEEDVPADLDPVRAAAAAAAAPATAVPAQ